AGAWFQGIRSAPMASKDLARRRRTPRVGPPFSCLQQITRRASPRTFRREDPSRRRAYVVFEPDSLPFGSSSPRDDFDVPSTTLMAVSSSTSAVLHRRWQRGAV